MSYVNIKSNEIDFEDDGLRIYVVQSTDRMAVRAAVKLAMEKWPNGFVINEGEAFVAMVEEAKALENKPRSVWIDPTEVVVSGKKIYCIS